MRPFLTTLAASGTEPAGGAETAQVILATTGAGVATFVLLLLISRYRSGRGTLLAWGAGLAESIGRLPGWAALPLAIGAVSLLTALFGMYWDISLHIDDGRDAGPLANPAHYFILAGLFGIFAAGALAIALPKGERPGPAAIKITEDWYAPVGGVLMALCGAYSLIAFPLDDLWHRIFGQDVTLWGPTHLMLIGGAGMTLVAQAILLREGIRARERKGERVTLPLITQARRIALMGGLLIGASTFQAEFDFGVPQFSLSLQPVLVAFAAGLALVTARMWVGRGGALGAAAFFLVIRGGLALIVGPVLGETTPYLPLFLGEAVCVELVGLAMGRRRPLALGAAAGVAIGTVGFAAEYAWSQFAMPHPWSGALLPEAIGYAAVAGVAGGVLGALLGAGLLGRLPELRVARAAFGAALLAIALLVANGLVTTEPEDVRASVSLEETRSGEGPEALATVRIDPPSAAEDADWLTALAWQGGGLFVDDLERTGPGVYRSSEPVPLHGGWKSMIRLHRGRWLLSAPIRFPEDRAIPAAAIEARPSFTRPFRDETVLLQRELKDDAPSWLWAAASLAVLALSLAFVLSLAWGLARVARAEPSGPPGPPRERRPALATPRPIGARP